MYFNLEIEEMSLLVATLSVLTMPSARRLRERLQERIDLSLNQAEKDLDAAYVWAAKNYFQDDGTLEIDEGALVSKGDEPGAYVMAWIWVTNEQALLCRTCGLPYSEGGDGFNGECPDCADKTEEWLKS